MLWLRWRAAVALVCYCVRAVAAVACVFEAEVACVVSCFCSVAAIACVFVAAVTYVFSCVLCCGCCGVRLCRSGGVRCFMCFVFWLRWRACLYLRLVRCFEHQGLITLFEKLFETRSWNRKG